MQKQSILKQRKGPLKYTLRSLQNTETSCYKNVTFFLVIGYKTLK